MVHPYPPGLGQIMEKFRATVKIFAENNQIPFIQFSRGQRKDEIAQAYRRDFTKEEGVVFIGVAQEKAQAFKGKRSSDPKRINFEWERQSVGLLDAQQVASPCGLSQSSIDPKDE